MKKKIAAGEVVEGPFSVIKELVENSLDAEATAVEVSVEDSGLRKISVRDNGAGILRDDILLAVAEHATSKIEDENDMENIRSFGFRGEALSSISAISDFAIYSRSVSEDEGARLSRRGGMVDTGSYAGAPGTSVIVENLFYNVPARKKFLKSKSVEMRRIRETVTRIALPNYAVSFSLDADKKRVLSLPAADSLQERLSQIHGSGILENLYFDMLEDIRAAAAGFFSRPDFIRPTRSMQQMFVNKRPVEYRYLGFLVGRAYGAAAGKGHAAAFVFIDIDPKLVDVNIHPAKREVKFADQKYIDSLIVALAHKVLDRPHEINKIMKNVSAEKGSYPAEIQHDLNFENEDAHHVETAPAQKEHAGGDIISVREARELYQAINQKDFRVLGVAFGTYIIAENEGVLHFIDFHAAHERMIYDEILVKGGRIESQELLFPKIVELPAYDHQMILEHGEIFKSMGFNIEDFSDRSVLIRAVPAVAKEMDFEKFIMDFADSLREDRHRNISVKEKAAASVACHSAKRSGDTLALSEMELLAKKALDGGLEMRCPHGRPFVFRLDKNDMERMFKRT